MKIKFLEVLDDWTEMQFLILQIDETDLQKLKKRKFPVGFKIVIDMNDSIVTATSGMTFSPEIDDMSMAGRSQKMHTSGTTNALGLLLNSVEDITHLPTTVNVEKIRKKWISFSQKRIKEDLEEEGIYLEDANYKKVFYKSRYGTEYLAVIDDDFKTLYGRSTTHTIIHDYYWIPFKELHASDFEEFLKANDLPTWYTQVITKQF